jgi:hypothetical protein
VYIIADVILDPITATMLSLPSLLEATPGYYQIELDAGRLLQWQPIFPTITDIDIHQT